MAEDAYKSCVYYAFIVVQVKVNFKPTCDDMSCFSGLHWMMKTEVNSLPLFPSAAATPFRVIDTQIKSRHYVSNSLNTGAWAMCVSVCALTCALTNFRLSPPLRGAGARWRLSTLCELMCKCVWMSRQRPDIHLDIGYLLLSMASNINTYSQRLCHSSNGSRLWFPGSHAAPFDESNTNKLQIAANQSFRIVYLC